MKNNNIYSCIILSFFFVSSVVSQIQIGQTIYREPAQAYFGFALDLSEDGKTMIIGARSFGPIGHPHGYVEVYKLENNEWLQYGNTLEGEEHNDVFGRSVSISADGKRIAISAPSRDHPDFFAQNIGLTKIFEYQNDVWQQLGSNIYGEKEHANSGIVTSLSQNGNRVAISSPFFNNPPYSVDGAFRVLEFQNEEWVQLGATIYNNVDSLFGAALAFSGNGQRIITTADKGEELGVIYSFYFNGSEWLELADPIEIPITEKIFNFSVGLSYTGDQLIVGAGRGSDKGLVQIYDLNNNQWEQLGNDLVSENNDGTGYAVDISADGKKVALSSVWWSGGVDEQSLGQLRMYEYLSNNTWKQIGNSMPGETPSSNFGRSIAISADGSTIAGGAPIFNVNTTLQDYVKVYGDFVSSQSNISITNNIISIFPNPASTYFQVNNSTSSPIDNISIFDINGKEITNTNEVDNIDISHLTPGIYLVNIRSEKQQLHTEKLIIHR